MQADARAWNALARKAFEGRKYKDALDLYLEALKHSAATASPSKPPITAAATTSQQHEDRASTQTPDHPAGTTLPQQQQASGPTDAASADPPELAMLCSNVAAVLLKLDRPDEALQYAATAVEAAPHWPKALYRQACALMACEQHAQAVTLLKQVQQEVDPHTREARSVVAKLHEAVSVTARHHHHLATQSALHAAHLSWVDTRAAEASCREDLLSQLQQGMAGVAWEPQDWEWRPTWMPGMRARHQQHNQRGGGDGGTVSNNLTTNSTVPHTAGPEPQHHAKNSLLDSLSAAFHSPEQQQQYLQLLAELTLRLAELEGPQRGYKLLQDEPLLAWYKEGLAAAVAAKKAAGVDQPVVLVVAHGGGGLLGMLAAAAGAGRVHVVEQGRWGFRAARQLLEENKENQQELVGRIELVPVPLKRCRVRQQLQQQQEQHQQQGVRVVAVPEAAGGVAQHSSNACSIDAASAGVVRVIQGSSASDDSWYELESADILVTDMFDYSVLGQGVLPMLQQSSSQGLLARDAILLPSQLVIRGQLVNTHMDAVMSNVSGFNVQGVNKYKWHPTMERIDEDRLRQYQRCSEPLQLMSLDLARYQQTTPQTGTMHSSCGDHSNDANSSSSTEVSVHLMGSCDACVVWFDLVSSSDLTVATKHCRTSSSSNRSSNSSSTTSTSEMTTCSTCFGLGLCYLDEPQLLSSTAAPVTGQQLPQQQQQLTINISATIVGQQQLNISVNKVSSGSNNSASNEFFALDSTTLKCVQHHSWSPYGTPRHAYLPRWHFDMLADKTRNNAYDAAIRREVMRLQQRHSKQVPLDEASQASGVHVLDIGTGTGLLAMMAARAGAETVTAVESVRHLAETARDAVALNGLHTAVKVVHKDGRYLTVAETKGSGDMPRPADLLAFEVFDCGLIGEGALHIVASARSALLRAGGKILPAAAKVYCQPIQYQRQLSAVLSDVCDPAPIYCHGWQQDYFEVDLARTCSAATHPHTGGHPSQAPEPCDVAAAGAHESTSTQTWRALAEPQLAFEFDFNCAAPLEAFQPAANQLAFCVTQSGLCNAVAFWFELQLDDVTTLSNSPYVSQEPGRSGTTWKQAVQLLPGHTAAVGQILIITASHDTYAISFTVGDNRTNNVHQPTTSSSTRSVKAAVSTAAAPTPADVPLYDPVWKAAYDRLAQLQSRLVKAITQDPLEYRRLVCAAMQLAMRPWGHSGDAAKGQCSDKQHRAEIDNAEAIHGLVWPVSDPHHAAAMLVRLMT